MQFLNKLGQIINIVTGGFTLPTEEQHKLLSLKQVFNNCPQGDMKTYNAVLEIMQDVQKVFDSVPNGRSVDVELSDIGTVTLKKMNGVVKIEPLHKV